MKLAKAYAAHLSGMTAETVTIEVDITSGLHAFSIVGLGDRAVDEAKDRISAAIKNSGYTSPKQKNQKVVVSLAPADIRKEGTSFDLAMAIAYLLATEDISFSTETILFLGELSLEGHLRKIHGVLPIICQASKSGFAQAFVPLENAAEVSLAQGIDVYAVSSLEEVVRILSGEKVARPVHPRTTISPHPPIPEHDFKDIRGNDAAKRGLEIAAAGAHNVILCGPPGTGKTLLAKCLPSILPPLSYEESVEVTGIHSAARTLENELIASPPFRAPHHTASYPAIVGGGSFPKPGEITLAHRGVLFLDELPEFDRSVIEALRQPMEDRIITISRARGTVSFPAQCMVIASMNPCPCGKGRGNGCSCSNTALASYSKRISGPIMDRIDIWIRVDKVEYDTMSAVRTTAPSSIQIRERIVRARSRQSERFLEQHISIRYNSEMGASNIYHLSHMNEEARQLIADSARKLNLSARAFHRVIKVARTIADLAGEMEIKKEAVLEALQYRERLV